MKTKAPDDNFGSMPCQQDETMTGQHKLKQIKRKPVQNASQSSVVRRSQSKVSNQRRKCADGIKMEKDGQMPLTSWPISLLDETDKLKIGEGGNVSNLNSKTYCCYLCGKTFQFLCRLLTHMTAHTNTRKYQCTRCRKRYKSSSSLSVHKYTCHSGDPRKSRSKPNGRKTRKNAAKKPIIGKQAIETPTTQLQNEYDIFNEIQMDMDDMEMEWAPFDDHVPFVWNESDLELTLPTDLIDSKQPVDVVDQKLEMNDSNHEVEELKGQTNTITSGILKANGSAENRPTTNENPTKFAIWEKETVDPTAWYVDILRPKSEPTHRPAASNVVRLQKKTTNTGNVGNPSNTSMKNTELAIKFRRFGDTDFSLKKWNCARHWYNRSLCYADQSTYYFSIAYAKRAQCFFNMGNYRACWTDLMCAQNSGLPKVLMPKLEQHKQSCEAMIIEHGMHINESPPSSPSRVEPMLSHAFDPMFPEMAAVLQINCNEYFGRHICARQPIAVGQILIIETGFIATSTAYYEKCCICLTDDPNLTPCSRCAQAMLCKNCENLHQIECELQTALNLYAYPWVTKVLRSFLHAIKLFESIDELMEFVDDAISSWRRMQPVAPIVDPKSKYRAFLQLITLPTIQPTLNSMVSKLLAALLNHPVIGSSFTSEKSQRFLAHLLIHHSCVINAFTTRVGSVDSESGCHEIIAPITSYLKHSCAPNVSKFLLGQSIIVVAMRPIESGEQLFVSYCDILKNQNERQLILQTEYGFQCSCERCQTMIVDQQYHTYNCAAIGDYVRRNSIHLTCNDQVKRKEIADHLVEVLQQYGRQPWNYTIAWAYVVYSLLLSQRFQKKLQY